jgi:adenine-specific DNA methylase
MAIPYMGSKRKSAQQIYQTIVNFNPQCKSIVDLFCGGFAISEHFIKNGWNVISNDKNKFVEAL